MLLSKILLPSYFPPHGNSLVLNYLLWPSSERSVRLPFPFKICIIAPSSLNCIFLLIGEMHRTRCFSISRSPGICKCKSDFLQAFRHSESLHVQ